MSRYIHMSWSFRKARTAIRRAEELHVKEIKRQARNLVRPMKEKLPPRLKIAEWNTDKDGSAIGVWQALELTLEMKLFLHDRRYMDPVVTDPEITRAAPLQEPREVWDHQ
ncbi:MAG: hypothetical protein Q8P03_00365, partial [bacterium]|nr:hypothetical protein [bacterium]